MKRTSALPMLTVEARMAGPTRWSADSTLRTHAMHTIPSMVSLRDVSMSDGMGA